MKPDQEKVFAEIKDLSMEDKVKSLIAIIDTPVGRRKYPLEMILLAKALREDLDYPEVTPDYPILICEL